MDDKPKRVLICEDDADCRFLLKAKLKQHGYEIAGEAKTGYQSLTLFMETKPDIVLLDIGMPKGSGLTVLRFIREIDQDIRIVMLTGDNKERTVKIALKLGANDYLIKNDISKSSIHSPRFLTALEPEHTEEITTNTVPEKVYDALDKFVDLLDEEDLKELEEEVSDESIEKDIIHPKNIAAHRMARASRKKTSKRIQ
ncbi:MAG: response regulator [Candidatus Omnitrophota bacterium]|jgi:YesN/AraC family two-component response regulator|nr:MAG: response regulator [Candidatus Omnitrophota bacterium]